MMYNFKVMTAELAAHRALTQVADAREVVAQLPGLQAQSTAQAFKRYQGASRRASVVLLGALNRRPQGRRAP